MNSINNSKYLDTLAKMYSVYKNNAILKNEIKINHVNASQILLSFIYLTLCLIIYFLQFLNLLSFIYNYLISLVCSLILFLHRDSYMSAHVLLNLLNKLGKRDKM